MQSRRLDTAHLVRPASADANYSDALPLVTYPGVLRSLEGPPALVSEEARNTPGCLFVLAAPQL